MPVPIRPLPVPMQTPGAAPRQERTRYTSVRGQVSGAAPQTQRSMFPTGKRHPPAAGILEPLKDTPFLATPEDNGEGSMRCIALFTITLAGIAAGGVMLSRMLGSKR